jgi:hypothetical protein
MVIETVLTMPGTTIEAGYQRRINAINAITAFCGVEEGRPTPRPIQSLRRSASDDTLFFPAAKQQKRLVEDETDDFYEKSTILVRMTWILIILHV